MPWTVGDVDKHHKGLTPDEKKQWVAVANKAKAAGKSDEDAIKMANGAVDKNKKRDGEFVVPPIGVHETRFADIAPASYDKKERTVDAVISMGSPVKRFYGTEILKIAPDAVILTRVANGGVPLLDSHNQFGLTGALGRFTKVWFNRGALMGTIKFHATERGKEAEGMAARGEVAGISAGYRVEDWEIKDKDGNIIDPEFDRIRWDDNLTFTAIRWELLEGSMVTVPADPMASIRSFGTGQDRALNDDVRAFVEKAERLGFVLDVGRQPRNPALDAMARMKARQAMHDRTSALREGR